MTDKGLRVCPVLALVLILLVCFLPSSIRAQSGVTYVYDDLGRVAGVIDPSGNAAIYSYDAVGNVLTRLRG